LQVKQTQQLLSGITSQWDFNAFHLDRLTGGHNLAFLCIHLFQVTFL
jgi:succinate dehydrogenase/fumarate reductase cytochrome b subunit